mgnify:CR=1 FL=1
MQSPNRFYYTWRLLFLHHSFAWCFFFYLSFLFPPVEPGIFNCCVTKKETVTKTVTVSFWQQTQFSIRVALGCKVALKCNPKSICNRPTNWNLYNSHFLPITAIPFFIEAEIRLTTTAATTTIITIKIRFSPKTSVRFINEKGPRITN